MVDHGPKADINNPAMILPIGTRIVSKVETRPAGGGDPCPAGIVGMIIAAPIDPAHIYRVRYANGVESRIKRAEFEILSHFQTDGLHRPRGELAEYNLESHIIYKYIVGSRAYGLDVDGSDTDRRGIYVAPCDMQWSLYGAPDQLEILETEECYWELQRFIVLGLKANPNILECLYSPMIERVEPLAQELLDIREIFVSKLIYQTYNGYVLSQFQKMNRDLRNRGCIKPKHAMHLIRLLLSGIHVLREGFVPVAVEAHRDSLLAIRNGEMDWSEVETWRKQLHTEFDAAFAETKLPPRPDYERANEFLISARRSMVS